MPVEIEQIDTNVQVTARPGGLSPELEKKVIEKVIAMLLRDLRIEAERTRRENLSRQDWRGGR